MTSTYVRPLASLRLVLFYSEHIRLVIESQRALPPAVYVTLLGQYSDLAKGCVLAFHVAFKIITLNFV